MLNIRAAGLLLAIPLLMMTQMVKADMTVSIAKLPVLAEHEDKGILVDLAKLLSESYSGDINIHVRPFTRSLVEVKDGTSAFHMPLLDSGNGSGTEGLKLSTESLFKVPFAIFSSREKPITVDEIKRAMSGDGGLSIETDQAHVSLFEFPIDPTTCLKCSLNKVANGRIDALIFASREFNAILSSDQNIQGITEHPFKEYDVKFVVKDDQSGVEVEKQITEIIRGLKASGEYQKVMTDLL